MRSSVYCCCAPASEAKMVKVLFVHGMDPEKNNGQKARYLRSKFDDTCIPRIDSPYNLIASLLLIVENIRVYNPDVVVASSFGAFLCLLLLQLGEWKGPTILLAPVMGKIFPNRLWLPKNSVCTIVHGRDDAEIDVKFSRILFSSASPAKFVKYVENDDDHSLGSLISGNGLKELVEDINTRYKSNTVPQFTKYATTPFWWLRIKLLFIILINLIVNLSTVFRSLTEKKNV
eukprot:Phypoly_transcript_14062.p1 GENE.Phypoly_transcript_14062~~Phypoly_transcript_14062.p1  ORF type:complete len:231 (+),score=25.68 Phypoly_transcript_14062:265-957(+)